jgi:hypothetical protein
MALTNAVKDPLLNKIHFIGWASNYQVWDPVNNVIYY